MTTVRKDGQEYLLTEDGPVAMAAIEAAKRNKDPNRRKIEISDVIDITEGLMQSECSMDFLHSIGCKYIPTITQLKIKYYGLNDPLINADHLGDALVKEYTKGCKDTSAVSELKRKANDHLGNALVKELLRK
jgi:hypothetical protein